MLFLEIFLIVIFTSDKHTVPYADGTLCNTPLISDVFADSKMVWALPVRHRGNNFHQGIKQIIHCLNSVAPSSISPQNGESPRFLLLNGSQSQ